MIVEKEEAEFTLTDVERLTGFNPETIRAWRKRGHLPATERYARVGTRELASLMVRKQLMEHGFGPADSQPLAEQYRSTLIYVAILDTPGACEVRGTAAALAAFEKEFDDSDSLARAFAEMDGDVVGLLVSTDGGAPHPGKLPEISDDSLTGYYINLRGLGRQFGAGAYKPLFTVRVSLGSDDQGTELVRRLPGMKNKL